MHPSVKLWVDKEFAGHSWYSFNGYQSGQWNDADNSRWINAPRPRKSAPLLRPVVNLEPCYEDHRPLGASSGRIDAHDVRCACYWSLLASPVAGVSYGAHGVWSWEDSPVVPLGHPNSGVARPWHEAIALPGSDGLSHLRSILDSIEWWRLEPCPELLAAQTGDSDPLQFVAVGCSLERNLALIYTPAGGLIQIQPDAMASGLDAICFDPANGATIWHRPFDAGSPTLDCGAGGDRLVLIKPRGDRKEI